MKKSQIQKLEKLSSKKVPQTKIITYELAEALAEISHEINKEIALMINRKGQIVNITVGDAENVELIQFKNVREGKARLCGIRCIHTHPNALATLSKADLTALANLRLDMMVAIGVDNTAKFSKKHGENPKFADSIQYAYLWPNTNGSELWKIQETSTVRKAESEEFDFLIEEIEQEFAKGSNLIQQKQEELALLVTLITNDFDKTKAESSFIELEELTFTAGAKVAAKVIQQKQTPDPATYIGSGKVKELTTLVQETGANIVIFDTELSPRQQKTLENSFGVKTIDRTELILDIFAQRARTKEGKLQVELAQLKYLYPRLVGEGLSLSRQGGGGSGGIATRGPGETKLEIDRRRIRDRINMLEKDVEQIKQQRSYQRRQRNRNNMPVVSIVGYTNAGKSTLLNALCKSDVLAEDKLFATLDPTTRRINLPDFSTILLTDTVGFIQKLPTSLIAAFRATLEEVTEADVILHVIDANNPYKQDHMDTVYDILTDLDSHTKPIITVFNKVDTIKEKAELELLSSEHQDSVFISATQKKGFDDLLNKVQELIYN